MKEDKKLIVTITRGGKPVYATQCKAIMGTTLLDDTGNANGILLGTFNLAELVATVAAVYDLIEDLEKKKGPEFKELVEKARKMGVRRND